MAYTFNPITQEAESLADLTVGSSFVGGRGTQLSRLLLGEVRGVILSFVDQLGQALQEGQQRSVGQLS